MRIGSFASSWRSKTKPTPMSLSKTSTQQPIKRTIRRKPISECLRLFFLQEPQVCIIRDLIDGEMLGAICKEVLEEERFAVSTIRAKDAAEALARLAAMKPPLRELAQSMTAVLNQRLVRKLCDDCKEAYAPPPNVLQQLGIPAGRVNAFYRPPQPPEDPREICKTCGGLGYLGRIGRVRTARRRRCRSGNVDL